MTSLREARRASAHGALYFVALFALLGCEDARHDAPDPTWLSANEALVLEPETSPIDGLAEGTTFHRGVAYGTDPQQVFDAFLPASDAPTPLVVYVHGGGFVGGTRTDLYDGNADVVRDVIAGGAAFITLDYRLLLEIGEESEGVRKCLRDSRRALQFIRHHAATLNVDPERVAIFGGSAGAGTSVWLAFHDDMGQRGNPDLIARQSTRVSSAAAVQTQATYDVMRWAPDVFGPQYAFVTNDLLLTIEAAVDLLVRFYGIPSAYRDDPAGLLALAEDDYYRPYRADLDLLELASADDPPLYIVTTTIDASPLEPGFDLLHHPLHATTLYEHATSAGVSVEADVEAYGLTSSYDGPIAFLLDHL